MNIPEGYVLVPAFPSEEMLIAMWSMVHSHGESTNVCYESLIDAAPKFEVAAFDEAKERELFEVRIQRIAVEKEYQHLAFLLSIDDAGDYRTTWVDMAWLGWQACAKSRARSAE